jgi:NAD(P)H-hydrate repair Nnr-like enzyme with NAD(P)H-hydrate dehydratase domain
MVAMRSRLKGRTALVADLTSLHLNPSGTSALATAGTGDVLSGIVATLLAQGLTPVDAGRAGAYWHGRAGAGAAAARPVGVVAGDIANALGQPAHAARDGWPIRIF